MALADPSPPKFFETGPHHVLCHIPAIDNKSDIPHSFQDSWDRDHVRLACSSRDFRQGSDNTSTWQQIVQGLTTPIHTTHELAKVMAQWNEGDPAGWNIDALEAFLDARSTQTETRYSTGQDINTSPRMMGSDGDDSKMSGKYKTPEEEPGNYYHTEALTEVQFLSPAERTRFFQVILPKMQELALRLPELIKKPIPFLKQQQDSAITLSQEQIACLLANAFFCTFPCRNAPRRSRYGSEPRKRYNSDVIESSPRPSSEVSQLTPQISDFFPFGSLSEVARNGHSDSSGVGGRTLDSAPRDIYGAGAKYARNNHDGSRKAKKDHVESTFNTNSKPDSRARKDPFRNAQGQMSLFAYFDRPEPKRGIMKEPEPARPVPKETHPSSTPPTAATIRTDNAAPQRDRNSRYDSRGRENNGGKNQRREPFPRYPSINFSSLFASDNGTCASTNAAKLRCIIHYFDRVTTHMPEGVVTFHRQVLMKPVVLDTSKDSQGSFRHVEVLIDVDSPLEDDAPLGALQLDFANKTIGGGVLDRGAVQEEIRFVICPELIIARLFTQQLEDNEALLMKGAERFSNYNGYARTFEWHSDHIDTTPRDKLGRRQTEICAIDALPFKLKEQRLEQFGGVYLMRELNKAIAGFWQSPITHSEWGMLWPEDDSDDSSRMMCQDEKWSLPSDVSLIATGNWGCGAFGGHLQLKFLIQWIAASVCEWHSRAQVIQKPPAKRDIIYYTYGLDDLAEQIKDFVQTVQSLPSHGGPELLVEMILHYPVKTSRGKIVALRENESLLEYLTSALKAMSESSSPTLSSFGTVTSSYF
ncbi:hypothetical protein BGZ94_008134 [Podila epigama]|nr:hypothetical protein BGZ94_008134 [Podila epigama]